MKFLSPKLTLNREDGGFFEDSIIAPFYVCYRIANKIWNVGDAQHAQLELSDKPIKDGYKFIREVRHRWPAAEGVVYLKELDRKVIIDSSIDAALDKLKIEIGKPVWAVLHIWV